jgi:hypothetical protein
MAQAILQQVLEQIQVLDHPELLQVSQAVQERLASQQEARKRQAFYQALRASGLVRQIKTRLPVDASSRRLIQVQGEPVSQTIIEERR